MKDSMEYKGYRAWVEYYPTDRSFHGSVVNIDDIVHFEGESVQELEQAFHDSVDDYLEMCAKHGEQPNKPYSGAFTLRLSPEVHREADQAARLRGESLNTFISSVVESEAKRVMHGKTGVSR